MTDVHAQEAPQPQFKSPENKKKKKTGFFQWAVVIVIIAAIVLGGLFLVSKYSRFNVFGLGGQSQKWQAVFLSNGQVYFGTISKKTRDEVTLRDIYYLQVTQPLQRSGEQNQQQQNELTLVKLGNELHGPRDKMIINDDHILFIEDLKDDSRVVEAIRNYKDSQQQ